jgi:hypothetical protein
LMNRSTLTAERQNKVGAAEKAARRMGNKSFE